MASIPCITVPSPKEITDRLFPEGVISASLLPPAWTAQILMTPFGGLADAPITPSDQLVIGNLSYDANAATEQYLRVGLYLLESLQYYDFLFRTSNGITQWWWLTSDPANPNGTPTKAFGPFVTTSSVPPRDFLTALQFAHAGSWKVHGQFRDAFSARKTAQAGTWYLFDPPSGNLARIMNVDQSNDFGIAVLGAFYFIDFSRVSTSGALSLREVYNVCLQATPLPKAPSAMVTWLDFLTAMASPPSGSQIPCTLKQIQALIPGISFPTEAIVPPSWTDRVQSECYMIGQDTYPYYCQVWYDWTRGTQVTVFVQKDDAGLYAARNDEMLPKGAVGPVVVYSWDGSRWIPACCQANGGFVPMPAPNFVELGSGRCRALLQNNPYFGNISIWTVALGDNEGQWASDFWYWFNDRQQGVVFSLAPAGSLTIIDYQTFVQNGSIEACVFDDPCSTIPACSGSQMMRARKTPKFIHVK